MDFDRSKGMQPLALSFQTLLVIVIYEHPYPMHIHACTGIYLVPRVCNTLVQWNIGNGEPWPIPQDNGNTNSGNDIGFLSF